MLSRNSLNDIIKLSCSSHRAASLVALVLAGILETRGWNHVPHFGGGFTKWMFWVVVFVTLVPLVGWFTSF